MRYGDAAYKRFFICFFIMSFISFYAIAQDSGRKKSANEDEFPAINIDIEKELQGFQKDSTGGRYRITLCADVPYNPKPYKVAHNQQSGHVFLILEKIRVDADTIHSVFGFYPKKGLPTLFFKSISSRIKDNSGREYDVEVSMDVDSLQFNTIIGKCIALSKPRYHINKYNCYDYAILVFNSVLSEDTLRNVRVRFPFIFGIGGSPVSVYKEMERLKSVDSIWKDRIRFGEMHAPISQGRKLNRPGEKQ